MLELPRHGDFRLAAFTCHYLPKRPCAHYRRHTDFPDCLQTYFPTCIHKSNAAL